MKEARSERISTGNASFEMAALMKEGLHAYPSRDVPINATTHTSSLPPLSTIKEEKPINKHACHCIWYTIDIFKLTYSWGIHGNWWQAAAMIGTQKNCNPNGSRSSNRAMNIVIKNLFRSRMHHNRRLCSKAASVHKFSAAEYVSTCARNMCPRGHVCE